MKAQTYNMKNNYQTIVYVFFFMLIVSALIMPSKSEAMPAFARQYNISCTACHAAFPRLNEFGEQFVNDNYRLPNWKDSTVRNW